MPTAQRVSLAARNLHSKLGGEWSSSRTPSYCLFSQTTFGANYYRLRYSEDVKQGLWYKIFIRNQICSGRWRIEQRKKSNWDVCLTDLAKLAESSETNLLIIVLEVKMARSLYLRLIQPPKGSQKGVAHIRPYSSDEAKPDFLPRSLASHPFLPEKSGYHSIISITFVLLRCNLEAFLIIAIFY